MGGYRRKNNPNKTHYRKGTTPKKGKPYTISQRDLDVHSSFIQDNEDYRTMEKLEENQKKGIGPRSMANMSDSPANFIPTFGQIGATIKGIKNRDEYGGGLKGAIKGVAGEITGGTEKNRNEEINSKLDTIIAALNTDDEAMAPDISTTSAAAAPLAMASPARFTEFMTTPQQAPASNNTGGKNPTFAPNQADRMMAVADPDVDTKGALFMKGGEKDNTISVKPYAETKGTDQITGYKKNKAGVKVNLANLPVNLKVGFEQKNKGYKSSISPSVVIGGKIKLKGKKQEKPKFT